MFYFVSTIAESLGWVLPSTLMVPSFMTWKSTRRSMVSSRKAISVISFSGSSWKGYIVSIVILTHVLRDSVPRTSKDGRSALARSQSLGEAPFRCSAASAGPLRRARSPPVWCRILSPDVGGIRSMFVYCGLESGLHNVSTVVWRFLIHQSGSPGSASSPHVPSLQAFCAASQRSFPSILKNSGHTLCEVVCRQPPMRVLGQVLKRDLGLALPYHQMHDDQALEDNGPRRVAQAVRQRAEDLGDAGLARMRRDEDVLDIFRLGCRELYTHQPSVSSWGGFLRKKQAVENGRTHLDLGPSLHRLLKGARHGSGLVLLEGWFWRFLVMFRRRSAARSLTRSRGRYRGMAGPQAVRRMR